jgi:hypothetical protein
MPLSEESRLENKRLFKELGRGHGAIGLPSIDGAIDCTHLFGTYQTAKYRQNFWK